MCNIHLFYIPIASRIESSMKILYYRNSLYRNKYLGDQIFEIEFKLVWSKLIRLHLTRTLEANVLFLLMFVPDPSIDFFAAHAYWWLCRPAWNAWYENKRWWKKSQIKSRKKKKKKCERVFASYPKQPFRYLFAWLFLFSKCVSSSTEYYYLLMFLAIMVYCTIRSCCLRIK